MQLAPGFAPGLQLVADADLEVAHRAAARRSRTPSRQRWRLVKVRSAYRIRQDSIRCAYVKNDRGALILRQIVHFGRVVLQIEQQRRQGGEMHVFLAPAADDAELAFVGLQAQSRFRVETAEVGRGAEIQGSYMRFLRARAAGDWPSTKGQERSAPSHSTERLGAQASSRMVGMMSMDSVKASICVPRPASARRRRIADDQRNVEALHRTSASSPQV